MAVAVRNTNPRRRDYLGTRAVKAALISLRREYVLSGEHKSTLALIAVLSELGVKVDFLNAPEATPARQGLRLSNLFDVSAFRAHRRSLLRTRPDLILIKIPTIAQASLASYLTRGLKCPVIILLDGLAVETRSFGRVSVELRHEPFLAIIKRLANHVLWARLLPRPAARVVVCSPCQLEQARRVLGQNLCGDVISNASASSADAPESWTPPAAGVKTIGYLGHAYAFKGCVDLIAAKTHLREPRQYRFSAALSASGRTSVRNEWLCRGGTDAGVVKPEVFFNELDVLCVPLHTDFGTKVYPNVLLEAMKSGVPLLTTRTRVSEDLLGKDPPFPMLDTVSPSTIARGLEAILALNCTEISQYLRTRYNQFDDARILSAWKALLREISPK